MLMDVLFELIFILCYFKATHIYLAVHAFIIYIAIRKYIEL